MMRSRRLALAILGLALLSAPLVSLSAASGDDSFESSVVVAVPDTGINPYHEDVYRPNLDAHPSTYIEGYPEDIPELNLSVKKVNQQGYSYFEAFNLDEDVWDNADEEKWYWIRHTPFVAVYCEPEEDRSTAISDGSKTCILDDGTSHGTGTTSAVLLENPDALVAFKQGGSGVGVFDEADIPVDVYSVSWGTVVPIPLPRSVQEGATYVKAAGNDPRSTYMDRWSGHPDVISVSGAYPIALIGNGDEAMSARDADVVAWHCRDDLFAPGRTTGTMEACGTSFSAPTVAGALSGAILDVREEVGYTGTTANGEIAPGITKADLRDAMNMTATYDPGYFTNQGAGTLTVPVLGPAPYLQWGWGWYDNKVVDDTVAHLLEDETFEKPMDAELYMSINHKIRKALYGW